MRRSSLPTYIVKPGLAATGMWVIIAALVSMLLAACARPVTRDQDVLSRTLADRDPDIRRVIDNLEQHELQILFTRVSRDAEGAVVFQDSSFQLDEQRYYYPASTVKLPIALLALEKLAQDPRLDRDTPMRVGGELETTTIAAEILKIFALSDNPAFNRLFEYLGQDEINQRLAEKGIEARIFHRLSTDDASQLTTREIEFYTGQGATVKIPPRINQRQPDLQLDGLHKGVGYIADGELVAEPFDFTRRNYLPLASLHGILKRLNYPEAFRPAERFQIPEADLDFLFAAMAATPAEAGFNDPELYPSYVKFLLVGDSREPLPDWVEIRNKVGFAYGTITDGAYIRDRRSGDEYLISATLLVNENQVFNDDDYQFDSVGIPFLASLGRKLLESDPL